MGLRRSDWWSWRSFPTYTGHSETNASYLFPWKLQQKQRAQEHHMIRANSQYKTLLSNIDTTMSYTFSPATEHYFSTVTTISYAFSPVMNLSEPACYACKKKKKICTSRSDPVLHRCYNGVGHRKMLPMKSIFHLPEQIEVKKCQIWTL